MLVHCNIVSNDYQQDPRVLHRFYIVKNIHSGFSHIEIWFTDQSSKPLETEDEINITLVIN